MTASASAPASAANLGPGFDCVALALGLRCRATVRPSAEWQVRSDGVEPAAEAVAFVLRVVRAAVSDGQPMAVEIHSDVPRTSGLGSSAAVSAAVAAAALRSGGVEPADDELFRLVARLEGHSDNAAAVVYGGLVAVTGDTVARLELSPELEPVVAVPAEGLSTREARQALPDTVPHGAAARSVARAVALVEGLRRADRALLAEASGDELHEAYRSVLAPGAAKLVAAARSAGALHASWSGAGPSVLAFVTADTQDAVCAALQEALGGGGRVLAPGVDGDGWR